MQTADWNKQSEMRRQIEIAARTLPFRHEFLRKLKLNSAKTLQNWQKIAQSTRKQGANRIDEMNATG